MSIMAKGKVGIPGDAKSIAMMNSLHRGYVRKKGIFSCELFKELVYRNLMHGMGVKIQEAMNSSGKHGHRRSGG